MNSSRSFLIGLLAGLLAAMVMTLMMLLLASLGIATPLAIIGDRLSVFIPPGPFLSIMGRVGGYNHLKQLGVGSTIAGQLLCGALGGGIFALCRRRDLQKPAPMLSVLIFFALPLVALTVVLWPVIGTSYRGFPILTARVITQGGFCLSLLVFERIFTGCLRLLSRPPVKNDENIYTPSIGRRALLLGSLGLIAVGGSAALLRRLYQLASFSYDGTQYKGAGVQPITPNELFYCVTKNVVDPTVDAALWRLEVTGLVQAARGYRYEDLKAINPVDQETTLMCISNGLDAGLISNAIWKGVPMRDLLAQVTPLESAVRVRLHGVDNYTDTIPLEKAMEPTTLLAWQMNGVALPQRHGFPLRAIVPGYFGEKHVKWLTRIELVNAEAKGFYEKQGWGPDFITPTRSRIDVPDNFANLSLGKLEAPIEVRGMAYGGDRGVSRVEISFDKAQTWQEAEIYYRGSDTAWSLWKTRDGWKPSAPGEYNLVVRATDGKGEVQEQDDERSPYSGATGFHWITVYVTA